MKIERSFNADPAFHEIPVAELISDEYSAKRRELIKPNRAGRSYKPGNPALEKGDTIFLTVADKDRNMVSLIQATTAEWDRGCVQMDLGFVCKTEASCLI